MATKRSAGDLGTPSSSSSSANTNTALTAPVTPGRGGGVPVAKRTKLENLPEKMRTLPPPLHAVKLNGPMLEHQNKNLAVELFTAKRRIAELEAAQATVEAERDHVVDCLSLVHRSWNELDADLRALLAGTGTATGAKPDAIDASAASATFEGVFAPAVKFSRVVSADADYDDDDDDDGDGDGSKRATEEEEEGPSHAQGGSGASEQGQQGVSVQYKQVSEGVAAHLNSRKALSKNLAQTLMSKLPSLAGSSSSLAAALSAFAKARGGAAQQKAAEEALSVQRRRNAELEEQLALCKFQRDRAKSKILLLRSEKAASENATAPLTPAVGSRALATAAAAAAAAAAGGKTPGWIRQEVARVAEEGGASPAPGGSLSPTAATSSSGVATLGAPVANTTAAAAATDAAAAAAAGAGAAAAAAAELTAEVQRLENEIRRINTDFDSQVAKHASEVRKLSEKLALETSAHAAAAVEVDRLRSIAANAAGSGPRGAGGRGSSELAAAQSEIMSLRQSFEAERSKRRTLTAHLDEKLALQADMYRKALRDLEAANVEKFSIKERYQRKVHQLETERHALRQTLKLKDAQAVALAAEVTASKGVQVQLDLANSKIARDRALHEGQLQQASEQQAKRILELEQKLREGGAAATAAAADGRDATAVQLAEKEKELVAARAKFHEVAVFESLYAEIERINAALNNAKAEITKLRGKLEEKAAECLKYSSAKTKSDRVCMHLKSEKLAYRGETVAANTLQKQLNNKLRNLEQQLEQYRPFYQENSQLKEKLTALQDKVRELQKAALEEHAKHDARLAAKVTEVESLRASLAETAESLETKSKAAEKFRRLFNEHKEKLAVFKRNKRKLMGDAAEKKQLYTMLECQVCTSDFKNVMLPCLHMFCKGCIAKQLKSRNRKCPACNQRFDADSVRDIVFNS